MSKIKVRSGYSRSCSGYWVHSGPLQLVNAPEILPFGVDPFLKRLGVQEAVYDPKISRQYV